MLLRVSIGVGLLLTLVTGLLLVAKSVRGSLGTEPTVGIEAVADTTNAPKGIHAAAATVATVRRAPTFDAPPLLMLASGEEVAVDGRTADGRWLRVVAVANTPARGWIDATELTGGPDSSTLPQVPPAAVPVEIRTEYVSPTATATRAPTSAPTDTPSPSLPDLIPVGTHLSPSGTVIVTVANQGSGPTSGDLVVAVFDGRQTALLGGATVAAASLSAGASLDVDTGFLPTNQPFLVIVNPLDTITESDRTNDRLVVQP